MPNESAAARWFHLAALEIIEKRGFQPDSLDYFKFVRDASPAGGRAKDLQVRFIIVDVKTDSEFAPHGHIAAFRAVQSTTLVGRIYELLGVLLTRSEKDSSGGLG